ncbi:MAG: Gfo/Idh/MocA family oxidoreductase [Treponema sp.]|jgi:predicted dehydrogenase|nr:Gfo/Idh/MocA family oxidoreductase [Treponema sp.]
MSLKVAIIGCGGIGTTHANCYKNDNLAQLIAVCDIVPEKAQKLGDAVGVPWYKSIKDMFTAHPEIEAVSVTTSGYDNGSMHFEPAMQALDAGKNVLVEKPICADLRDAQELVRFAAQKKLYLGCNLNHYFTKTAERADELIKDKKIGELVYCIHKVGFNGSEKKYGGPGSPRWQTPYSHVKAFCAHPFSVMRHFCGDIMQVQAFMDRPGVRRTANDPMLSINGIHVRFANGGIGYLLSQRGDAMFGLGGWWSYEHAGTKGTFCIENAVEKLHYWDIDKVENPGMASPKPEVYDTGITDFGATFPSRIHAWLEDLTNKVPLEHVRASGRDALATLSYTFAAMRSYEEGGALVIPEALPALHGDIKYVW